MLALNLSSQSVAPLSPIMQFLSYLKQKFFGIAFSKPLVPIESFEAERFQEFLDSVFSLSLSLDEPMLLIIIGYLWENTVNEIKLIKYAIAVKERERKAEQQRNLICHEIRTPLHQVSAGVEQLEKIKHVLSTGQIISEKLLKELTESISNIEAGAELGSEIATDVLDLARLQAGKLSVRKDVFNVKELIQTVARRMTDGQLCVKNKELVIKYETIGVDQFIQSDKFYFQRILINLLSNALKFTQKGHIKITATLERAPDSPVSNRNLLVCDEKEYAQELKAQGALTKRVLRCSVEDTGSGMNQHGLAKLFQEFSQAKRSNSGSGLGLVICKQMVEAMGGKITVTSELGKGTIFTFTLQCLITSPSPTHQRTTSPPQLISSPLLLSPTSTTHTAAETSSGVVSDKKILIVDDSAVNRRILCQMVGSKCDMACNGEEAVQLCGKKNYDLIFMDCVMPIMDGLEATTTIREIERYKKVPIIGLSGNALTDDKEKALKAGMSEYLTKPFVKKQITAILTRYQLKLADDTARQLTPTPTLKVVGVSASMLSTVPLSTSSVAWVNKPGGGAPPHSAPMTVPALAVNCRR